MARKTKTLTLSQGRDGGKKFLITEMSAFHAENWASRAIVAIINSGNNIDFEDLKGLDPKVGIIALVGKAYDLLTGIKADDSLPLWNELMSCIQVVSSNGEVRELLISDDSEDIEEWTNILVLKKEAFQLHTDFLKSVVGLNSDKSENQSQGLKST